MDGYNVPRTGAGLSVVVGPGSVATSSGLVAYNGGPVTLPKFATSYCYIDTDGQIRSNQSGFPSSTIPVFVAITDATGVLRVSDSRPNTTSIGVVSSGTLEYVANGIGDGNTTDFTFTFPPSVVYLNGLLQDIPGDVTVRGNVATFVQPPGIGDTVAAVHIH